MNYTDPYVHTDVAQREPLEGLEHIDMRHTHSDPGGTWIGDVVAAVWRRRLLLSLWILFCFATSLTYTIFAQPEYVASAQIVLEPRVRLPTGADAAMAAAAVAPILDSAQAESQLQIVRSVRNLSYVFDTLNLIANPTFAPKPPGLISRSIGEVLQLSTGSSAIKFTGQQAVAEAREIAFQNFSDRIQARRLGQSYVIEVSFRGSNPEDTARITNSIVAAYIRDQILVRAVSEQRGTEFLQGRITLIQAEKKAADEAVASGNITDFQFPDSDARIVGAALKPLSPAYPQTKLDLIFGILVGLVTGVVFIVIVNNFDQTVRSPAQIRRLLGVDCLAVVPRMWPSSLSDTTVLDQPESDFARAMRNLRTVLFTARTKANEVSIGFVSYQDGSGCSSLTVNLARLLATSNSRVVLIDANLQEPDLSRRLAANSDVGLDQFIQSSPGTANLPEVKLTPSLSFVPAVSSSRVADPNAFLGTHAMRTALTQYNGVRDLILDLPPLDSSSNAQAVGSMLSGVVIVASINRIKLDQLSETIRALHSANTRVLGIVLNDPINTRKGRRPMTRKLSESRLASISVPAVD